MIALLPSQGLEGVVCIMGEVGRLLGVREDLNLCTGGLGLAREYSRYTQTVYLYVCLSVPHCPHNSKISIFGNVFIDLLYHHTSTA